MRGLGGMSNYRADYNDVDYDGNVKRYLPLVALSFAAAALLVQTGWAQDGNRDTPLTALPFSPAMDLSSMDRSVDPCTDFYRYACGGWIMNNPIPPDQAQWNVYSKLAEDNERFLWNILQDAAKPAATRSPVETQIGDFFNACMDEGVIERVGAGPLKAALDEIAALRSLADLPALLAREQQSAFGNRTMFNFDSNQDYADSTHVIAFASAGGLGLPDRDYYTKTDAKSEETRRKYEEHVQKMLELLGEAPEQAKAHASTVMEMETALARASLTRVDQRDPYKLFHKMGPSQLQALTPLFPWKAYLSAQKLSGVPAINVTEPAFFKELQTLLQSRSLEDWKTYLRWHLVHVKAPYLSAAFATANFDFYSRYLRGVQEMPPRWKRCVRQVDAQLGEALGQVFVQKTFGADTKARALLMTKDVESAMESEIRQLPWMGEATKKRALEKLHAVKNKIAYPEKWRDYSSIRIARDDFYGNVERAALFESGRQLAKIGKPLDRNEWQMTPPTVNAYYDPQMNDINFPAGVLQPPLFIRTPTTRPTTAIPARPSGTS